MDITGKQGKHEPKKRGGEERKLRVKQLVAIKMLNYFCDKNRFPFMLQGKKNLLFFSPRHAQ
jgi:hypothetical protein